MRISGWRAWLNEPLLHFLAIGAALFFVHKVLSGGGEGPSREIVVSDSRIAALSANFQKTWMRPPTVQELSGMVDDYVADEVYYREATAMGLDRDDAVIRRRLRQKMEFISSGLVDAVNPTDGQLQDYLKQNAAKFTVPARLTFQQVFVSLERRGADAQPHAQRILASLNAGGSRSDPRELGDSSLLPPSLDGVSPQDIANTFGTAFAEQIEEAPVGQWSGPLRSGYGLHLVRVGSREVGSVPTLAEVRPIVLREWQAAQGAQTKDALLSRLRAKYDVRIEGPAGKLLEVPPANPGKKG